MGRSQTPGPGRWRVQADTGGTFTDVVGVDPAGRIHRTKVLSTSRLRGTVLRRTSRGALQVAGGWPAVPGLLRGAALVRLEDAGSPAATVTDDGPDAHTLTCDTRPGREFSDGTPVELAFDEPPSILGARLVTRTPAGAALPPLDLRLATTLATNALLTAAVEPVVLFVTRGLADLLVIGDQSRPDLFALGARHPAPLHAGVVEVDGRVAADGTTVAPLDRDALFDAARAWSARGLRAAAVALIHADRHPEMERTAAAIVREAGFARVALSSDAARAIRLVPRASTAVADAALAGIVDAHMARVRDRAPGSRVHVMTSAGGLATPAAARPTSLLLSGPAGGVVGAANAAAAAGIGALIGFDMGGTSTDVARHAGAFEYDFEHRVGPLQIVAPALSIHTVAAGGGSVCAVDEGGLRVGPESAGAQPGPACYGAGGPLTLTDVDLLLGRIDPARFRIPVDVDAARAAAERVRARLEALHTEKIALGALLDGLREIADERMAGAIREITTRRGVDPAGHALVAFGGAGGLHACSVAARLGIGRVLVPADAGLLSARGLSAAVLERFAERQVLAPLDDASAALAAWIEDLSRVACDAVASEGAEIGDVRVRRRIAALRLAGQDAALDVEVPPGTRLDASALTAAFRARYEETFGYVPDGRALELVTLRVVASAPHPPRGEPDAFEARREAGPPPRTLTAPVDRSSAVPARERASLAAGEFFDGPTLVTDDFGSTWVASGWRAVAGRDGSLLLEQRGSGAADARKADARGGARRVHGSAEIRLELFTRRATAIAREMGRALERTAVSTNVRERRDFSCALLDPGGRLVVNAPHIPVHLGSLGLCVRRVVLELPLAAGDIAITNHPAFGGSHLPDVTLIAPVHTGGRLTGYVAARAHHAEIGGSRPGSMPPRATRLEDEGVIIPPMKLFEAGHPRWDALTERLTSGRWPSRAAEDNLADVRAAVAALRRGAHGLARLVDAGGHDELLRLMDALRARAARRVSSALSARGRCSLEGRDALDDGTPLAVRIVIDGDRAGIDFEGTGGVHPGNLNATPAIVRSVVLYVLRLLVADDLPLNEGLLEPVDLRVPEGLLSPPFPRDAAEAPAVTGGNVETSQRLANLLVTTLGLAAASQGTMNNVLFGDAARSHYETIAGGCGAGPGFDGPDAVHSHMTNTRITDPEVLEVRHPVRLLRFAIRTGSGGAGRQRGGDGVVRELEFTAPLSLSVLTQHRGSGPRGLEGGAPGAPGRQRVLRADGSVDPLAAIDGTEVLPGDRLEIETPGGGGWGAPDGGAGGGT